MNGKQGRRVWAPAEDKLGFKCELWTKHPSLNISLAVDNRSTTCSSQNQDEGQVSSWAGEPFALPRGGSPLMPMIAGVGWECDQTFLPFVLQRALKRAWGNPSFIVGIKQSEYISL